MKKVLSVSLGSSKRDSDSILSLGGTEIQLSRRGTDGDLRRARQLFLDFDGQVDAFGLGGTDLRVRAGGRDYYFRESLALIRGLHTPVVDGSGLKDSLERRLIISLGAGGRLRGRRVLMMCASDRFGMAEALQEQGAETVYGDLLFGLGVPVALRSLNRLAFWIRMLAPLYTRLPVRFLYPMGAEQEQRSPKGEKYFRQADIIAGDFHYIRKFMPEHLGSKTVITNTVTAADREFLHRAGVEKLLTTTPNLEGRSYGTNVLEAALVAYAGADRALHTAEYIRLIDRFNLIEI